MPTSVVQAASEYNSTAAASVPPTLHLTVLSVAPSGATVAVNATLPPTSIVCAMSGERVTPLTATVGGAEVSSHSKVMESRYRAPLWERTPMYA